MSSLCWYENWTQRSILSRCFIWHSTNFSKHWSLCHWQSCMATSFKESISSV